MQINKSNKQTKKPNANQHNQTVRKQYLHDQKQTNQICCQ